MKDKNLVERYDDNPGAYFGMLVEGFEDKDEFLKESVSKSDLYSALEYMYGFNKKEANNWIKKSSDEMKQSVVDGWKGNAKKSALTDSLKEDKFVSRDKMSKKDRKELDSQKRNTWGNTSPVTRVQPNKKAYDRKRDKKVVDEALTEDSEVFKDMSNALDDIEYLCNDTYNWGIDEWNDKSNVKNTAERIIDSANILLDSIKKY